jgi:hypothetical protein
MHLDKQKAWNPYLAGAMSGILIILSVVLSGNYFGTSTSFVQIIGMLQNIISPEKVAQMEYFSIVEPGLSWQILFVLGIFIGGFVAAKISGDFKLQLIPDLWKKNLGSSPLKRGLYAFVGGIIAMFGARLAGGCPSGQMSSSILLSISGFLAMTMFFIVGIIVARLIYVGGAK